MVESLTYKNRKNTNCEKWDGMGETFGETDLIPLWVADMDFESPSCVKKALSEYVQSGIYGYYRPPVNYIQSFIKWEKEQHSYEIKEEWVRFVPGVVPAIYWMVQTMTEKGDHVLVMPPVYYPFFHAVQETDRILSRCPLICENGCYKMNFDMMERKIVEEKVKLFILCSPHNPVGRVWTREELKRVLDICNKYNVFVISDEIHQDLIPGKMPQIPAGTVGDSYKNLATVTSGTKTFNIAGCQNAFIIIENEEIREKFDKTAARIHMTEGSSFGYVAVEAAYSCGKEWLELVLKKIWENYNCLKKQVEKILPDAVLSPLEGTYLAWLDLSAYVPGEQIQKVVQEKCGLAVDYGEWFGGDEYASCIRINLATKTEFIQTAVERLAAEVKE